METTVNQRIEQISNLFFKRNISLMARELSISQSALRDIVSGKSSNPGYDILNKIVDNPTIDVDAKWLLTGGGEIQKNSQQIGNTVRSKMNNVNVYGVSEETFARNSDNYQEIIKKQQEQMDNLMLIIKNLTNGK